MKRFDAIFHGDALTADIHDSVFGGVDMVILLQRQGRERDVIHFANYSSYEEAEKEMRVAFPSVIWR